MVQEIVNFKEKKFFFSITFSTHVMNFKSEFFTENIHNYFLISFFWKLKRMFGQNDKKKNMLLLFIVSVFRNKLV